MGSRQGNLRSSMNVVALKFDGRAVEVQHGSTLCELKTCQRETNNRNLRDVNPSSLLKGWPGIGARM